MKIQFLEAAESEFEEAIDFYNQQRIKSLRLGESD